jgi:prepilin-type N-terminal cleavage/methylation domain-containing protein
MKRMLLLRRVKQQKAFTLVEVLIALVILAIALLALAGVVMSTTMLLSHTIDREQAVNLAVEKLEELEGVDYDTELVDSSDQPYEGKFSRVWDVTDVTGGKNVELTVTWEGIVGNKEITMEREISDPDPD